MFQDENKITYDNTSNNTTRINKARANLMLSLFLLILAVFILIFSFAVVDKNKYQRTQTTFKAEEILASKTGKRQSVDDGLYKRDPILPIIFHTEDNNFQFVKYHTVLSGLEYIMNIPINEIFVSGINITKFTSVFLDQLGGELVRNPKRWKVTFFGYTENKKGILYDKDLYSRLGILSVYLTQRHIDDESVSIGVFPVSKNSQDWKNLGYISVHITLLPLEETK